MVLCGDNRSSSTRSSPSRVDSWTDAWSTRWAKPVRRRSGALEARPRPASCGVGKPERPSQHLHLVHEERGRRLARRRQARGHQPDDDREGLRPTRRRDATQGGSRAPLARAGARLRLQYICSKKSQPWGHLAGQAPSGRDRQLNEKRPAAGSYGPFFGAQRRNRTADTGIFSPRFAARKCRTSLDKTADEEDR